MKAKSIAVAICLMFLLASGRCSKDNQTPPPEKKITTVKIATGPEAEKPKTPENSKDKEAKPDVKEGEDIGIAAPEQITPITTETYTGQKEAATQEAPGNYTVKKGECLSSIAAGEDVYKDPLKWPALYRLNLEKLRTLKLGPIAPDTELPEGTILKTTTSHEIEKDSKTKPQNVWTINVVSTTSDEKIPPVATRLIENGYPAYITRVQLKDKEWMRLRVGFFKNKTRAEAEGKKIMAMLDLDDSWVAKAGEKEVEEFGGY
ncbi:MAG TPA: SPOR domain-containing protein [Desulfatiglandales bacterium]|nr:SPOR domain-containing protein [Desulfatiglandales bacterium]